MEVRVTNVPREQDAAPLVRALEGKTYMNLSVLICPVGGGFDVRVQTLRPDTSREELTEMVLGVLASEVPPRKDPLTFPTLHLNGSGYERLFDLHAEANGALRNALNKLAEAAPHGRDFYVQGDGAFEEARKEHEDRLVRIRAVMEEMDSILESLYDQNCDRAG